MSAAEHEDTQAALAPGANHHEAGPDGSGPGARRFLWQGKVGGAFWKFATIFSFVVNLVLVIVVLVLVGLVFNIKRGIAQPLVGGLYGSFVAMDEASIVTTIAVSDTITVNDTIPVVFDLPLQTGTVVTLTQATPIHNTTVVLNGLSVPTDIILPAGTPLNIQLDLNVPVSKTVPVVLKVPVNLTVPVNIPLSQTELHQPFNQLRTLFSPYSSALDNTPNSWSEIWSPKK